MKAHGYWPPSVIGLDPTVGYTEDLPNPTFDPETGTFVPGAPPPPPPPSAVQDAVLDYLTFRSPDGSLWRASVTDAGEWLLAPTVEEADMPAVFEQPNANSAEDTSLDPTFE